MEVNFQVMDIMKNQLFLAKLIWNIDKRRVIYSFIYQLFSFISWIFYSIYFISFLFSDANKNKNFSEIVGFIWIVAGISFIHIVFNNWFEKIYTMKSDEKIKQEINILLFQKVLITDISYYEDTNYYDSYTKATVEASDRAISVINGSSKLVFSFLSSLYVAYIMTSITLYSIPFVIIPLIGNLYFGKKIANINYSINEEITPILRKLSYIDRIVFLKKYSLDMRVTNLFELITDYLKSNLLTLTSKYTIFSKKKFINYSIQSLILYPVAFIGMWTVGAYLALQKKSINLEDFIKLSSAIVSLTWMLSDFTQSTNDFFSNGIFIKNLKVFLEFESKIEQTHLDNLKEIPDKINEIEFRHVFFRYPNAKEYVLNNISFTLKSNTINTLIGLNGSGKSTIIKLLLRLYDPTEGIILVNGIDIKKFNVNEYRRKIGVSFQDSPTFSATIYENVLLDKVRKDDDMFLIDEALEICDAKSMVDNFSDKGNSILTQEFSKSGYNLSGGQNQKISNARAFSKKSQIVVLDEPTSALDPEGENEFFKNAFNYFKKNFCISIIITHRLSIAKKCDNILLLEYGELKAVGDHTELYSRNPRYKELFDAQLENYIFESERL